MLAPEVRVALQLDGKQVGPRIEPDDELAPLPLDLLGEPVGEVGRRHGTVGVDVLRHLGP